jgi:imidazolonepropionase-like amidohydrolase
MAAADNAELPAPSGQRSVCPGKLSVMQEGALADLLLVNGDPIANITLVDEPAKNLRALAKDGKICKCPVK